MNKYRYWQDALAGKKPKAYVDYAELGFYRRGIYERNDKGNKRRVGWEPVAIFSNPPSGALTAVIGADEVVDDCDKIRELWSYCCANPISEETYRAVAERGEPWPEEHDPAKNIPTYIPVANSTSEPVTVDFRGVKFVATPALEELGEKIAAARAGISQYDKIETDEMAARAASLKNELTALIGQYDKIRESLVRPHLDAQKEINGRFNPTIKAAQDECKQLLRNIGVWEDFKREQATKSATNAPPPSEQIAPAVGRKLKTATKRFVVDIDIDKAIAFFRDRPALRYALMDMAQNAIDAGLEVPGALIEERTIVR